MWSWLKRLFVKPHSRPVSQSIDEYGDEGLSDSARTAIDRLREEKGWGVRPTARPTRHLRSVGNRRISK